eukprot:1706908-Pyramimonas_sp.AAC.2
MSTGSAGIRYTEEQNETEHELDYYQDYEDGELIDWAYDEASGLRYRKCWTENEAWLDDVELDQAYQMSGFRPRYRRQLSARRQRQK